MLSLAVAFLACNVVALCQEVGTASREQDSPAALSGDACPNCKSIPDHPCCIDGVYVDEAPPVINCPEGVSGNADCGEETIHFTFDPIVAIDNCDSDPPFYCLIANDNGADVDHLLDGGGDFPVGTTSISCWATDSCSQEVTCQFDVVNTGMQGVHLDLQLSPTVVSNLMTRGIDIKVSNCDAANPVEIEQCLDVEFGGELNMPGYGSVQFEIPIGNWVCVEATDRHHTLRSTCLLTCEEIDGESVWFAAFEHTPDLFDACHWLINGNLNQDEHVDILDYAVYQSAIGGPVDPNSTCDTPSPHADINGDHIVNIFDFTFILLNFFDPQSDSCDEVCADGATGPPSGGPRDSVSVAELLAMGYEREDVDRMDRDNNGVVDLADMAAYLDDPTDDPLEAAP